MEKGFLDSVGNTPLVKIDGVWVKLEYLNPSGSIKDRIAKYIVEKAECEGLLKKGHTIVEATSGNTGISFSMVSAIKGYKMVAVMPRNMTGERIKMMESFGAKIVLVKSDCFMCAKKKAREIGNRKNVYTPLQFDNEWNIEDHEKFLGKEIANKVKVDAFVAGVGTGGTVIGVGKVLKRKNPKTKVFALEPDECHALSDFGIGPVYGKKSKMKACMHHDIGGIGDGMVPDIVKRNSNILDGVFDVKSKDAVKMAKKLCKMGYFVGPSSGANFIAAKKLKKKFKNVVTVFPDSGDRYISQM